MSRIAYIGVLTAGAVLTVVGLVGAGSEAAASGEDRVCAAAWCPKERPGWRAPSPRGDEPPSSTTSTTTTTTSTTTTTKPTTTTSTTKSTTSSTTSSTTTTTSSSSTTTTPPVSTTTTTRPVTTTTTKPPTKTKPPVKSPPRHDDNRLANTGTSVGLLVPLGVLLAIAGALLLLIDRRRHSYRR
ncbi:LPXTG cell wall anchor domain-containing protein [Lentzea alba]|uniref:LPXTG cell wall anchor domain-containing protein n=1 Tax=Lentzea alba TaxID=2714351 RepID=UPI0039BFD0BD